MFFLNGNGMELVNSDYVERFCMVLKNDAALVVASYSQERPPVTLGRYQNADAARSALLGLQTALAEGKGLYAMDESVSAPEDGRPRSGYHGSRRHSHGGS